MFNSIIDSENILRDLIGKPSEVAQKKVINFLDSHCQDFISKSPFLVMSTTDKDGFCDVSPRGDQAGFVLTLNERYLVIPERKGNNRVDSLRNILQNPRVGLLFIIPGLKETLRVNGKASIIQDEDIMIQMVANGKKPLVGIAVEIEECFIQCGKALKRSSLWQQESWLNDGNLPSAAKILSAHVNIPGMDERKMKERLEEGYIKRLY
ncbi:pyridoxamine 5'-phosphate oxidase family protein [Bacillus sp. CGMCC 1.16607]|uniref:pyridoxamine 5'-phosphate oxidase family protein n=1 Tax=Bacillus sp. CGMCC 1.16607 TaxID=3351842 RepID=UPI003634D04B